METVYIIKKTIPGTEHINETCADVYDKLFYDFRVLTKNMSEHDKESFMHTLMEQNNKSSKSHVCHFEMSNAKALVLKMSHTDSTGKQCVGEYFSLAKAKDVFMKHRDCIDKSVNFCDVYVALNAQYHDYVCILNSWCLDCIDDKIIELAMNFWFMDEDYNSGSKIWNYFNV